MWSIVPSWDQFSYSLGSSQLKRRTWVFDIALSPQALEYYQRASRSFQGRACTVIQHIFLDISSVAHCRMQQTGPSSMGEVSMSGKVSIHSKPPGLPHTEITCSAIPQAGPGGGVQVDGSWMDGLDTYHNTPGHEHHEHRPRTPWT